MSSGNLLLLSHTAVLLSLPLVLCLLADEPGRCESESESKEEEEEDRSLRLQVLALIAGCVLASAV